MIKHLVLTLVFLLGLVSPSSASELRENQLDKGIRNSLAYSNLLIQQSLDNKPEAVKILKKAVESAPDFPAPYFALAKASLSFSVAGILDSVDYVIQGIGAYTRNFWSSFSVLGSLYFSLVFSFAIALIFVVAIRLFSDLPLLAHDITENRALSFILLIPLTAALISPFLLLAGILVILGIYMKKSERAIVYLSLIVLLLFPVFVEFTSLFLDISLSGRIKAVAQVNESRSNDYALAVLENPDDFESGFSYALALKRSGEYSQAIKEYKKLSAIKSDPRVLVNLGNCYVGLYNFDESNKGRLKDAMQYYLSAITMRPLASGLYNLSQVSRELLDFSKGDTYFRDALALDRDAVSDYRTVTARNPNRFVADETLSQSEIRRYAVRKARNDSFQTASLFAPSLMSGFALALLCFMIIMHKRSGPRAFRCKKCAAILCSRCENRLLWGQMCPQCYGSLIKLDELDVKERVSRLLRIYEHQRKRRMKMKILSFLLPGLPYIYAGKALPGFFMLWSFLFFLFIPAATYFFKVSSLLFSYTVINWTALCIALGVYAVANHTTRRRMARGWL